MGLSFCNIENNRKKTTFKRENSTKSEKIKNNKPKKEEENKRNSSENAAINIGKTIKKNEKKIKIDIKKSNVFESYIPSLNTHKNCYILCPKCKMLFPDITKFSYDNNKNDFKIDYKCKCSKNLGQSYLLDFINPNRPSELNKRFNEFESKKLVNEAKKKNGFQGSKMLESAIKCSLDMNGAAPPASIINPINMSNLKVSQLNPFKEKEGEKENKKQKPINKKEIIISERFPQRVISEENSEYTCIKTFNKNARISSLIQLDSGDLASGSYDCIICIWDIEEPSGSQYKKEFQEIGTILCLLEFKPGYLLAGTNYNYISLWNLDSKDSNNPEYRFLGHELWVNSLAKCDETKFASCSNDKNIIIWDYNEKKEINRIEAHDDCVLTLIKLKNELLCSGGADSLIKVWNWKNGKCIYKFEGFRTWIRDICQFNDNTILICSGNEITVCKNYQFIKVLNEHKHDVRNICIINEEYFASASFDNTIKIWNINDFTCEQTLEGHTSNVINIIKLKGTENLASSSCDETIKIWSKD